MLDRDVKERIADFFEPWELVEYLGAKIDDVIDAFEDEIEERLGDLEELMGFADDGRGILGASFGEEE